MSLTLYALTLFTLFFIGLGADPGDVRV